MKNKDYLHSVYYDGDIIKMTINNQEIEFKLSIKPKELIVTLYSGNYIRQSSCKLSTTAQVIYTESPLYGSRTNEYGTYKVNELIKKHIKF